MEYFLILISPFVGSFLGVLADRLPRGEDVILTPSDCRDCGTKLRWLDLIPLVSYLRTRGQCAYCAAPIPAFVPLIEVGAVLLTLICISRAQSDVQIVLGCLVLWCLLALAICDMLWFRLPDVLTLTLFLLASGLAIEDPNRDLASVGLGASMGAGSFLAIRLGYQALRGREGLGLGDVKLMAGLGALLGAASLPAMVLCAAVLALLVAGITRFWHDQSLQGETALPFGTSLAVAGGALWLIRV